jgi:hypothetical protein
MLQTPVCYSKSSFHVPPSASSLPALAAHRLGRQQSHNTRSFCSRWFRPIVKLCKAHSSAKPLLALTRGRQQDSVAASIPAKQGWLVCKRQQSIRNHNKVSMHLLELGALLCGRGVPQNVLLLSNACSALAAASGCTALVTRLSHRTSCKMTASFFLAKSGTKAEAGQ